MRLLCDCFVHTTKHLYLTFIYPLSPSNPPVREIHSNWREVIKRGVESRNLPITLSSPNTSHEDSDDCGAIILGMEKERKNWDRLGGTMNSIRTNKLLEDADIVVVR